MIQDFELFTPKTLDEALSLLNKYKDSCKVIAGGQTLIILMRQGTMETPRYIVDIKRIPELNYIRSVKDGLRIGATTTHRIIEKSPVMKKGLKVLAEMESRLSYIETRNWGTIGGNLCNADPAGDGAPVLMALNATIKLASTRGVRAMALEDFFIGPYKTVLKSDELLTEIQIPTLKSRTGVVYNKFNIIEGTLATAGVAISMTLKSGNMCNDVRIALGGMAKTPILAIKAEKLLRGKKITEALLKKAGQAASAEAKPVSDILASSEYRRELVKVMVARAGNEAFARAKKA
ncbi:MAG TPA: xanthine dehydrogenase family protein subunit M [Desulfatiglandales bacterium]|nr:xanthine dehydrogenase family protein subunit M [Desulfatiglandales bacterium]